MGSKSPERVELETSYADMNVEDVMDKQDESVEDVIDIEKEKKLLLKIDIHLIPILCLLLLAAFLDRYGIQQCR